MRRLHHVPLTFQRLYGCSNERSENEDREDGSEVFFWVGPQRYMNPLRIKLKGEEVRS